MTPTTTRTDGAAKRLLLMGEVRPKTYIGPCDFDGDSNKESEAVVEVLIPNGFGDSFHLHLCNSCLQKMQTTKAQDVQRGAALADAISTIAGIVNFLDDGGAFEQSGELRKVQLSLQNMGKAGNEGSGNAVSRNKLTVSPPSSSRPESTQRRDDAHRGNEAASDADNEDTRTFLTKMGLYESQPHFWEFPPDWKPQRGDDKDRLAELAKKVEDELKVVKALNAESPGRAKAAAIIELEWILSLINTASQRGIKEAEGT
jgi:hypothetical protein